MIEFCDKHHEFFVFQTHLLNLHIDAFLKNNKEDKNKIAIDFIWKYSSEIRKYFCKEICGHCEFCHVYVETTRLKPL